MMMVLGWLLGLKMRRFWWDFGTPAFIVWVALELQEHLEQHLSFDSAKRLLITLAIAGGVFLGFTSDRDSRWTENLTTEYLCAGQSRRWPAGCRTRRHYLQFRHGRVFPDVFIKIRPRRLALYSGF